MKDRQSDATRKQELSFEFGMDKNGAHILTKQQAVPHLIHSAIRMFVHEDDPFAIHVLIHAADSILNDIIENRNTELKDWNNFIPINRRREF